MKQVSVDQLTKAATNAGLTVRQCSKCHWQLIGGISIVNFYNSSKGTTIYVQGTAKGRKISDPKEAIDAAVKPPAKGQTKTTHRKRRYRGVKNRKWAVESNRRCHWCKVPFVEFSECTADHVVPISLGGSNGDDNIVLACHDCNNRRGNKVSGQEILSTRTNQ